MFSNKSIFSITMLFCVALLLVGCDPIASAYHRYQLKSKGQAIDTLFVNGRIYTVDSNSNVYSAMALSKGEIIALGNEAELLRLVDEGVTPVDLKNRWVLPGIHDAHIHALAALTAGDCDVDNEGLSAKKLVEFLKGCVENLNKEPGEWIILSQFAPTTLMMDMTPYTSIKEALDSVSTEHPIFGLGSDGHAYVANSLALTFAQLPDMEAPVAVTAESLNGFWRDRGFAKYFGVDHTGEPDGVVKDAAAYEVIRYPAPSADKLLRNPSLINTYLHEQGITSIQEAFVTDAETQLWKTLVASQELRFRGTLNLSVNDDRYRQNNAVDVDRMIADSQAFHSSLADNPWFKSDAVKVMLDGVIEYPTQTAAMLNPYLKPIVDEQMNVTGYRDASHEACAKIDAPLSGHSAELFKRVNGFNSADCFDNHGILEYSEGELKNIVQSMDAANILVHIHALGDRAVHVALNAVEYARDQNGSNIPHSLAHTQLVHANDVSRVGPLNVAIIPTFAWAAPDWEYDITVNPFIDPIRSLTDLDDMYGNDNYVFQRSYPVNSMINSGAIVAAGSDAPVDVRSPRVFSNIAVGLSRQGTASIPEGESKEIIWNPKERLSISQLIRAYTIEGAKAMRQDHLVGSLEPGKRADFIVIDRDILELAENGEYENLASTRVLQTWFEGELVYQAEPSN